MTDLYITLFGAAGLLLVLIAFFLNHKKSVVRFTYIYNGLMFLGSGILACYAWLTDVPVFLALNAVWAGVALYFILKKALKK